LWNRQIIPNWLQSKWRVKKTFWSFSLQKPWQCVIIIQFNWLCHHCVWLWIVCLSSLNSCEVENTLHYRSNGAFYQICFSYFVSLFLMWWCFLQLWSSVFLYILWSSFKVRPTHIGRTSHIGKRKRMWLTGKNNNNSSTFKRWANCHYKWHFWCSEREKRVLISTPPKPSQTECAISLERLKGRERDRER